MQQNAIEVFHGSAADFHIFDPARCVTAKHLYTTLDPEYAHIHGDNILEFMADLGRHFDMRIDHLYDGAYLERFDILRQLHAEMGIDYGYDEFDKFLDVVTGGEMYQAWCGPKFQDAVFNHLFAMGFDSVAITECGAGRMIADVVVFRDPERLNRVYH